jgi:Ca2+-binding EF-hand superfamily protein
MRKLTVAALLLTLSIGQAIAQVGVPGSEVKPTGEEDNQAECMANFRLADRNGDGVLTGDELSATRAVIPTDLGLSGPIGFQEFLDACTAIIPRGG